MNVVEGKLQRVVAPSGSYVFRVTNTSGTVIFGITNDGQVKSTGAIVSGPIPLPTHKRIFTVNRSTFVNKKSREQFQLSNYKRLIDIYNSNNRTIEALMKLELASGVDVEIKV